MDGGAEQIKRVTFRDLFAVSEFRVLWTAQVLSVAGDQLARVALTILVYDRTRSAFLAAVTFVASVVPTFVGGVTLAGLADRFPRREVLIGCDLSSCVLVLVMAIPGVPLVALVVLLFAVTLVGAPFTTARAALYPDVLAGDKYVLGTAVTLTTSQFAQVIGFAVGGAVVGFFGVRVSLLVDAVTFGASAVMIRTWVRGRPALRRPRDGTAAPIADALSGARLVFTSPALRTPMLFGWLAAFYNVPEGVVAPLARTLHGGSAAIGMLLAAGTLGVAVGAIAFSRLVAPTTRLRSMGPLAVGGCAVLVLFWFRPGLPLALVILAVSGVFACYQIAANAAFVSATPQARRGQAFGLALGGMSLGQGVAMILAGAAAQRFSPASVIAAGGVAGMAVATAVAIAWAHER